MDIGSTAMVEKAIRHPVLPRQEPIADVSREKAYASTSKNIVAPMTIIDNSHHPRCDSKCVCRRTIGIAILDAREFGTAEGRGGVARREGGACSGVRSRFAQDALTALADGGQNDVRGGARHDALAKVVAMLHIRDETETGVRHDGDILQLVIDRRPAVAVAAGIDEMCLHSSSTERDGGSGENELARLEACRGAHGEVTGGRVCKDSSRFADAFGAHDEGNGKEQKQRKKSNHW